MLSGLVAGHFPFVARLSDRTRAELGALRPVHAPARRRLLARGDPAGGAYFVTRGTLRVYYITPEGREATLYRVEPGGTCVLALTATFGDGAYPAWVDAGSEGAEFVRLPEDSLRRLFDEERALREFVLEVLAGRVFELMRTLEEAGSTRVEERLALHLLRRGAASGVVRQSQAALASDLGTAREVVSRALSALAKRGCIRTGRGQIHLVDAARLGEVARVATSAKR